MASSLALDRMQRKHVMATNAKAARMRQRLYQTPACSQDLVVPSAKSMTFMDAKDVSDAQIRSRKEINEIWLDMQRSTHWFLPTSSLFEKASSSRPLLAEASLCLLQTFSLRRYASFIFFFLPLQKRDRQNLKRDLVAVGGIDLISF